VQESYDGQKCWTQLESERKVIKKHKRSSKEVVCVQESSCASGDQYTRCEVVESLRTHC
jgi:hypothetical protein